MSWDERDRAQQFLDMAAVAFIGIGANQRIFLINRKGCEIFGYSEEELLEQNYFDLCIPERHRNEMRNLFIQAVAGEYQLKEYVENPIITKTGEERIILWHTVILSDQEGKINGILSSGEDITERKIAEAALKASEEKFRSLVENTTDWVWELDERGQITYSNSSIEDILGYTAGQVIGRIFWDYIDPKEANETKEFLLKHLSMNRSFRSMVRQFIHRDGYKVIVEASARPIINTQGQSIGFRGVSRDITQRILADSILRESEALYRALVETSPDAITLTDLEGRITLVNDRTVSLLGHETQKELLGKNFFDYIVPTERNHAIEILKSSSEKGVSRPNEFRVIHKDGSTFPAEISAAHLLGADRISTGYILVTRNISERKEAERELEEAKARAEFFTDLMAHDLNNINQAILSALELQIYDPEIPKNLQTKLQLALQQVERSSALIGRVKKFSRIESIQPLLEIRDLEPDFQTAFNTAKQSFPNKTIRVDTNIHPGKFKVFADDLIIDLFFNLLHNAIKFDRNDRVEIGINVFPDENKRFLRVEISDNGPGIPDDLKERIFARYTQRIGKKIQGSGIGLTLVQRIVGRYGGKIWVEDRVKGDFSKGAKFIFLLPRWN